MSQPLKINDPARTLLSDNFRSCPQVFKAGCYICEDPEFAMMGLPLCKPCSECGGHIAADDVICDDCGYDCRNDEQESICVDDSVLGTNVSVCSSFWSKYD